MIASGAMPRRTAHRRSRSVALEDSASGLANEVIRRRSRAGQDSDVQQPRKAAGDGCGMTIREAADVQKWAQGRIAELEYEEAWVLVLDWQHRLIRAKRVEAGTVGKTHLDPERVVGVAMAPRAAGFILVHNHPSDIPKPGAADIDATHQVMALARQRGGRMLDSVIVGRTSYASLHDLGLMSGNEGAASAKPRGRRVA